METSISEEIDSSSGVRFLGAELHRDGLKWWVTQQNYIQDLLVRNLGGDTTSGQKKRFLFLQILKPERIRLAKTLPMFDKLK